MGLDPKFADDAQVPGLTPELAGAFIDTQLQRLREAGCEVDSCLINTGERADTTLAGRLASKHYDFVIGAGCAMPR